MEGDRHVGAAGVLAEADEQPWLRGSAWLPNVPLQNSPSRRSRRVRLLLLGGSSSPGPRPGTVASISRRGRPSACSTHERGPEQAPRTLRWRLLLRLAERHCDPGGVRVEVHRLVDRRGDALVTGSQAATVRTGTRLTQTTRTTPLFGCDQVRAVVLTAAALRSRPPPAGCTAGDHDARPPTRRVTPTTHARPPALEASPTQRPGPHNADAHHQRGTSQTTCHPPRPDQPNQTVTE